MSKKVRQNKIIEIISTNEIDTQEELAQMLNSSGFDVTQATVSRDVKELGLIKSTESNASTGILLRPIKAKLLTTINSCTFSKTALWILSAPRIS